nr:FeoA domain-containing protein [Candidatus Parabeggiatoa sp.]
MLMGKTNLYAKNLYAKVFARKHVCVKNTIQGFPLTMAGRGERVKIVSVTGDKMLIKRLIVMGLLEETELEVLHLIRGNGLKVACFDTQLALGVGMANKIMVVPIEGNLNDGN